MAEPELKEEAADVPKTLIKPPHLYLGAVLFGLAFDRLVLGPLGLPVTLEGGMARIGFGVSLALAGIGLTVAAAVEMAKAGTNIPTWQPTLALVTSGVFAFLRNPIYAGLSLVYLGVALILGSLGTVVLLPVVLVLMQIGVVSREERYLEAKFGAAYTAYCAQVSRWGF